MVKCVTAKPNKNGSTFCYDSEWSFIFFNWTIFELH